MRYRVSLLCVGLALACAPLSPVAAQEKEAVGGYSAVIDNIDLLIDNYARFLARKYDLTDEQDSFTRDLLRTRAYSFLDKHEHDLRGLVDRLFEVRTGAAMSPEELVEWGSRVTPIYDEAKSLILAGNNDFRTVLNEQQQKIHDADLKQMDETFQTVDDQLHRIAKGEMTVEEFRNPMRKARPPRNTPPVVRHTDEPTVDDGGQAVVEHHPGVTTPQPGEEPVEMAEGVPPPQSFQPSEEIANAEGAQEGEVVGAAGARPPVVHPPQPMTPEAENGQAAENHEAARNAGAAGGAEPAHPENPRDARNPRANRGGAEKGASDNYESEWDKYVQDFIAKYGLDESQKQKAEVILADCKEQAGRYMNGKKSDIERLEAREKELQGSKEKSKAADLAEIGKLKQKLREPIKQIFERQLKPRLDKLPTRTQRKDAEAAEAKNKHPVASRPASRPAKDKDKP